MKKRVMFSLVLLLGLATFVLADDQINEPVVTLMEVRNSSPQFIANISNITLAINQSYEGELNLFDHFLEPNGDNMFFTVTPAENLTITINQTTGAVSIYPDANFIGTRYIVFNATDGMGTVSSNNVTVGVGTDTEPPKWYNPRKTKSKVYQSSHLNFTTDWVDNVELKSFIFSFNEGLGWRNSTVQNLTGKSNRSIYSIQISVPALSLVQWRFYATDESNNTNATDIQSFNVSAYPIYPSVSGAATKGKEGATTGASTYAPSSGGVDSSKQVLSSYVVDTDKLKVSIKQGDSISKTIRITNQDDDPLNFTLSLEGLENLAYLSETTFNLLVGEIAVVTVDFIAALDHPVDEYFGSLLISSKEDTLIPIVVDVNSFEPSLKLSLNISEEYKLVKQGNPVKANLKILSLKDLKRFDGNLTYAIKDFEGNIIDAGSKDLDLYDVHEEVLTLNIPLELKSDDYLFYARYISEDNIALDSELFIVGTRLRFLEFLRSFFYLILLALLLIILLILFLLYRRAKKKRKLLELYLMLNELKYHVKHEEIDAALNIYIRIKNEYGQPVSNDMIKDKEQLKEELKKFAAKLKDKSDMIKIKESLDAEKEGEKEDSKETKEEAPKEEGASENQENPKEENSDKKEEKSDTESSEEKPEEKTSPEPKEDSPKESHAKEKPQEEEKSDKKEEAKPETPKPSAPKPSEEKAPITSIQKSTPEKKPVQIEKPVEPKPASDKPPAKPIEPKPSKEAPKPPVVEKKETPIPTPAPRKGLLSRLRKKSNPTESANKS